MAFSTVLDSIDLIHYWIIPCTYAVGRDWLARAGWVGVPCRPRPKQKRREEKLGEMDRDEQDVQGCSWSGTDKDDGVFGGQGGSRTNCQNINSSLSYKRDLNIHANRSVHERDRHTVVPS